MIIQFPNKNPRQTRIQKSLHNLMKLLDVRYDHIVALKNTLEKVEKECTDLEGKYDELFKIYCDEIGAANVEREFLDYTDEIDFVTDELGNIIVQAITYARKSHTKVELNNDPEPSLA